MDQETLLIHRIRFFTYEPTSINFMSYCKNYKKIALLRRPIRRCKPVNNEPSIIEIWNLQDKAFFLEQKIYEDPDQLNLLEGLAWHYSGRLFSVGLNSYLNEYDLINGQILKSHCINDPGWCLTIKKNLIAVGTEKGFVSIFEICPNSLQFQKIIHKNENRILCIEWSWYNDNLFLVCGSIDFIKIINYDQGKCVDFIKVGNNNVVVWCVKVLKDFTIVSGDSNGATSFWNGNTVTLIRSFYAHRADVLTLCASEDQNCIYSAGVDPTIVQFKRINDNYNNNSWVHSWKRRPHNHDVRSIFTTSDWLFTGGIDSFFSKVAINAHTHISHLTNLMNNVALVCKNQQNYIALMYEKSIQIWKLGSPTDSTRKNDLTVTRSDTFIKRLKIMDNAIKLLDINSRKPLIAFDFNAEWLIYANYNNMKIVTWSEDKIEKIKLLHNPIANISNIHIINENRMAITYGKKFDIFKLDPFGVVLEKSNSARARIVKICSSSTRIIVVLINFVICIYDLANYSMLNSFNKSHLPCAVEVDRFLSKEKLWLSYADSMLIEYDLESLTEKNVYFLNKLKSNEEKERQHFNQLWPIKQIAFAEQSILLSDDNNIYKLNLEQHRITKCSKYHHTVFMKNIDEQSLVIVEITPSMIMENLPPMLYTKKFGT